MSMEVCLYAGADLLQLTCQSEGGARSVTLKVRCSLRERQLIVCNDNDKLLATHLRRSHDQEGRLAMLWRKLKKEENIF